MKKATSILTGILTISLLAGTPVFAYQDSFTTGKDWTEKMSPGEKYLSVFVPSTLLRSYGVPLKREAQDYILVIDKILEFNPQLLKEDVANIFASTVYRFEPQTRPALEALEARFLRGDMKMEWTPRLAIRDSLDEYPESD